jgi:uncharacterized membrane protein YdbT with pleckstrin-like domain
MKKMLQVTHVNIRLSISFLLLKLVLIELIAATGVVLFFFVTLSDFLTNAGFILPFFSIPVYIVFVIAKMLLTGYVILQWLNQYYEISPEMVIHRKGIIFRHEEKYPLKHMRIIDVNQSLFGRIFNYGTIILQDPLKIEKLEFYQIHNPVRYAAILEDQLPEEIESIQEVRRHIFESEKPDITIN